MFDAALPFVPDGAVTAAERRALEEGCVAVTRTFARRFRLTGTGRVACLQGLVTCDVAGAGDGAHLFGALLTEKGMIVTPLWITRLPDEILVEAPTEGAVPLAATFARSLPPRLCRAADISGETVSIGVYGPGSAAAVGAALALPVGPPETGAAAIASDRGTVVIARAVARGAAGFDCVMPAETAAASLADLAARGATAGSAALLEACRILAGLPRLGAEIDDKTLPQEARLDELGAVSFTKGCYLGQETVARLHFRGHANRGLACVTLEGAPAGSLPLALSLDGKPMGRLASAAWADELDGYAGVAMIRREVADGADLELPDGVRATVRRGKWLRPA